MKVVRNVIKGVCELIEGVENLPLVIGQSEIQQRGSLGSFRSSVAIRFS